MECICARPFQQISMISRAGIWMDIITLRRGPMMLLFKFAATFVGPPALFYLSASGSSDDSVTAHPQSEVYERVLPSRECCVRQGSARELFLSVAAAPG